MTGKALGAGKKIFAPAMSVDLQQKRGQQWHQFQVSFPILWRETGSQAFGSRHKPRGVEAKGTPRSRAPVSQFFFLVQGPRCIKVFDALDAIGLGFRSSERGPDP